VLLLLLQPVLASELVVSRVVPYPELTKQFQRSHGWTGGDGAYTVPLNEHSTVWLFGDTFIDNKTMINNSIATQNLRTKKIEFFWKTLKGKPASIFPCPAKDQYYWPLDGATIGGKLYLFMRRVHTLANKPGPFNFEVKGVDLLVVDNPLSPPTSWRSKILHTRSADHEYGLACLVHGGYLYAYDQALGYARVPTNELTNPSAWEFHPATAKNIAPEFTVKRVGNELICIWLDFMTRKIMLSRAEKPEGPWSAGIPLYTCKEPKDQLVYSAKHHPELSQPDSWVITYCRNLADATKLQKMRQIYRPAALFVDLHK
jgi:hypothetical protein